MAMQNNVAQTLAWRENALELLDQRWLPQEVRYQRLYTAEAVAQAIRDMVVRGAPAIGIAAAYGVVLAAQRHWAEGAPCWREAMASELALLATARPTAVNLCWALRRMERLLDGLTGDPVPVLLAEAQTIHQEDVAANQRMGQLGAALLEQPSRILTHCNAGALATGGYGTALGVIRAGYTAGLIEHVYADETRPWLQGARLTAWELLQEGIPVTLLVDGAAAALMKRAKVDWVIVGADRITANGDVANKIGTYQLAVAAHYHGVKFMVVAPSGTIDMNMQEGSAIPIEQRSPEEVRTCAGRAVAAVGAGVWNPSFDVTPAALVTALVTELGVILAPNAEKMAQLMAAQSTGSVVLQ